MGESHRAWIWQGAAAAIRLLACLSLSLALHVGFLAYPLKGGKAVGRVGERIEATLIKQKIAGREAPYLQEAQPYRPDGPTHREQEPVRQVPSEPLAVEDGKGDGGSEMLYIPLRELDSPPRMVEEISADFPELVGQSVSGRLVLSLWIDEYGQVVKIETGESDLPQIFSDVARRKFLASSFIPGEKNGVPVKAFIRIVFHYGPVLE